MNALVSLIKSLFVFPDRQIISRIPRASETLTKMGIADKVVYRVVSKAKTLGEMPICEFDQNNRVISFVGEIPIFESAIIGKNEFKTRSRNRMQVIIHKGVVCVKKAYGNIFCFSREIIALKRLSLINSVPKIVTISRRSQSVYQSYLVGKNLGSLMVANGAPVSIQHQVSVEYPGPGKWSSNLKALKHREMALGVLRLVVDLNVIASIVKLIEAIHRSNVIIGDIKYGNVIIMEKVPSLCDFDYAIVHGVNSQRLLAEKERELDFVAYSFGVSDNMTADQVVL